MTELGSDILVAGGGLGGIAAAIAAARLGKKVVLTEETDWIGGQLTAQCVPPDEHRWIESFGCTASYRALRDGIRAYYRSHYPLTAAARADPALNPGASLVTRIGGEPRVALTVLHGMLAPFAAAGLVHVLTGLRPVAVETGGDQVLSVQFAASRWATADTPANITIRADYVLDATETGELLPLGGVEHVTGRESVVDTGEPDALQDAADPLDMQSITWVFALDHRPGEDHTIARPASYDFWRGYQAGHEHNPHFHWHPKPSFDSVLFPDDSSKFSVWQYRRVLYRGNFAPGFLASDVTLINAPHNDYTLGPIIGVPDAKRNRHLDGARDLSRAFLYWMQTEAPRPDGGAGWPGLRPRPDVTGTGDGLAKQPYIRESRRILAQRTIVQQDVAVDLRRAAGAAEHYPDSVGIGSYTLDRHTTTRAEHHPRTPLGGTWPFQIPLGALLPRRVENLLPAAKNLGTTHITNSCYRLHPIEWNVGEAAGALAAFCLQRRLTPHSVRARQELLSEYQNVLQELGVELAWPKLDPSLSYHKWAIRRPHWHWAETDRMPTWSFPPWTAS